MISGEGVGGGDEKDLLKDNLMRDIQDGFRQRRLPDGGFKVSGSGRQIDIINMERPSMNMININEHWPFHIDEIGNGPDEIER